jgi:hypothetical protein
MLGFRSLKDAKQGYLDNYEEGWQGLGSITPLTMQQFKTWLKTGDQLKSLGSQEVQIKAASDLMEKRADFSQMLRAIADPAIRQWAGKRGLVVGDPTGSRHILDVLNDAAFEQDLTEALYGAAQEDRPSWERLMKGLAVMSGADWSPGHAAHAQSLSGDIAEVAPYMMRWAPDVWDKMHGGEGSVASLTHAIAEQNRHNADFTPENAHRTASAVFSELYGGGDPKRSRGFSAAEMGKIYQQAAKRGMIDTDGNPDDIAKVLSSVAGPISAIKDSMGNQGMADVPFENMFQVYDQMVDKYQHSAADIEEQVRRGEYLRQRGASSAFELGLQQQGGAGKGPGTSLPELTALDERLRQQAAESPMGNIAAATMRLSNTVGLAPGSPGARLAEQIQNGELPRIHPGEWTQMMMQSGVDANTVSSVLMDRSSNQMHMTPTIANAVRQNQLTIDLADHIPKLPAGATQAQQVQHQDALNYLARSRGYEGWEQLQQLHGQPARTATGIMQQAGQQAELYRQYSPYGRKGPLTRTLDVVRNATPETGIKDIFTQGVLNVVPEDKLPKTSLGTSMAKGLH